MKHILYTLIAITLLSGCEKIFHPADPSLAAIESYEDLLKACGGVYGRLADAIYPAEYGYGKIYLPNLKGDDITRISGGYGAFYSPDSCSPSDELWDPQEEYYIEESELLWEKSYLIIVSANNVLTQFPDPHSYETEFRQLLGEIYLIRAYTHYRLTRCFGRVPIITDTEVKYNTPLPKYDNIYRQIEQDLKLAFRLLPERASEARIPFVTPHKGSAKIMLAEIYLNWAGYPAGNSAMYHQAAQTAGNIIDSAWFYDLELLPDFREIWHRDPFMNTEVAFSVFFSEPIPDDDNDYTNPYAIGYTDSYWNDYYSGPDTQGIQADFYACEINFYNNYPASYRKDLTFQTTIYVPGSPEGETSDTGMIKITQWNSCGRPMIRKFLLDTISYYGEEFGRFWMSGKIIFGTPRVILYRYPHTLLTYAEAKAMIGEADASAYEAVNMIRRRANHVDLFNPSEYDLPPGLATEQFVDSVVWERAWEFAGEPEGRWFDLLRLNQVKDLPSLRHPDEGDVPVYPITTDDYFFPIPESDIYLNPNLGQ